MIPTIGRRHTIFVYRHRTIGQTAGRVWMPPTFSLIQLQLMEPLFTHGNKFLSIYLLPPSHSSKLYMIPISNRGTIIRLFIVGMEKKSNKFFKWYFFHECQSFPPRKVTAEVSSILSLDAELISSKFTPYYTTKPGKIKMNTYIFDDVFGWRISCC